MTLDYKETVYLPKTEFSMKAGLNKLEPQLLARWKDINLYENRPFIGRFFFE